MKGKKKSFLYLEIAMKWLHTLVKRLILVNNLVSDQLNCLKASLLVTTMNYFLPLKSDYYLPRAVAVDFHMCYCSIIN